MLRTFLVFTDLPEHIEYLVQPMPLMDVGRTIRFEEIVLRHPSKPKRQRRVSGDHSVTGVRLVYSGAFGLTQYVEISPASRPIS